MKNIGSFDLDRSIRAWREHLAQSPALQRENLDELESHIRDSIATLQTRGLSESEAFLIASGRIGVGRQLEDEFEKVNRNGIWLERLLWMLIGVQSWSLVTGIAGFVTQNLLLLGWKNPGHDRGMAFSISVVSAVRLLLLIATAYSCWWLIVRKSGGFSHWVGKKLQKRSSFLGCCIATSLLLIAGQILFFFFQAYWIWQVGPKTFGERTLYLGHSQVITHLLQAVVMVLLILGLVRKRLVSKNA
jgi:hypothetical protein